MFAITFLKVTSRYPTDPVLTKRPAAAPRNGDRKAIATSSETEEGNNADANSVEPIVNATSKNHNTPACPDHPLILSENFGMPSVGYSQQSVTCDQSKISAVPFNVFHGSAGSIFEKFCFDIDSTKKMEWKVNSHGEDQQPRNTASQPAEINQKSQLKQKRTPPPDANTYNKYKFILKWEPDEKSLGCGQNVQSCYSVFSTISRSQCGHQGGKSCRTFNETSFD